MVRPKKHLGQHFLRDENIARKIVAGLNPGIPLLLEIGPGTGVLTKYLQQGWDAWFMEIDAEAVEFLETTWPGMKGRIIHADFLEYDLDRFPPGPADPWKNDNGHNTRPPFAIVGNFPYNISSQILFRVLAHRDRIPEVTGMFQKEVAERIASPPGRKTYGILSVLLQAWYEIDYLFTVGESVFFPPPRVKSAVIRLRRREEQRLTCDEVLFTRVVKMAFNQRRKTLRNALRSISPDLAGYAPLAGLLNRRAEQLSVEDFAGLAAEIATFAEISNTE